MISILVSRMENIQRVGLIRKEKSKSHECPLMVDVDVDVHRKGMRQ